MDILASLSKTADSDKYVMLITYRYSKLPRAIPETENTRPHASALLLDHWVMSYAIGTYVITDHGPQFVGKSFAALFVFLGTKQLSITSYSPLSNGKTE